MRGPCTISLHPSVSHPIYAIMADRRGVGPMDPVTGEAAVSGGKDEVT
jgi:hypothetical protein